VLGIVASRNGRSRNGRVRNGRSRIGRSRIGTSTQHTYRAHCTVHGLYSLFLCARSILRYFSAFCILYTEQCNDDVSCILFPVFCSVSYHTLHSVSCPLFNLEDYLKVSPRPPAPKSSRCQATLIT
jgi:hypothetical protein